MFLWVRQSVTTRQQDKDRPTTEKKDIIRIDMPKTLLEQHANYLTTQRILIEQANTPYDSIFYAILVVSCNKI